MDWKSRLFETFVSQKVLFALIFCAIIIWVPLTEQNASALKVLMPTVLAAKIVDYATKRFATNGKHDPKPPEED